MPTSIKEYNGILYDQLDLIDDILEVAEKENATETIALLKKKKRRVERKLQEPPKTEI